MIVIVTARRGSKRFPGKNVMPFNGGENIVMRTRRQAEYLGPWKIIITTDYTTEEIGLPSYAEASAKKFNFTYHRRKMELCQDGTTSEDAIMDVLDCEYCGEYWDDNAGDDKEGDMIPANLHDEDYFVLLQPTSPFRFPETLVKAKAMFEEKDMPALVSLNPNYEPNGSFYFCKTKAFLEEKTLYPKGTHFWMCDWKESIDINHPWEFRIAEAMERGEVHGI